ncbi:hypothetical protein LWI28_025855 [Acer negundo]|uniref:Uncharacterized protein n=1 Tax=Acer negundo TaxID=4023 RepID=A0AAD5J283_ACENE|nr:hypothetical protein LWI28_025855 [Acer negundo]
MGWEIVRQESFNKPGERSRLHRHEDVCQVLKRNTGTEAVKGLLLDINVEQLWEGKQYVPLLKRLILGHSQQLTRIPDLSEFITSNRNYGRSRNKRLSQLDFMFTNSPKLNVEAFSNVFTESLQIIKQMGTARKKYQKEVCVSICYPGSKIPEWFCYQEPEIIQTSISHEKFDSTNQDLVPDPQTIPEKKLTLFINNKVVPFYRILLDKVRLWLFYCWIFLFCLFCGICVFGMLVFLVLQLSTRCETYLSSHVQNMLDKII